jgi:hypothetical protein
MVAEYTARWLRRRRRAAEIHRWYFDLFRTAKKAPRIGHSSPTTSRSATPGRCATRRGRPRLGMFVVDQRRAARDSRAVTELRAVRPSSRLDDEATNGKGKQAARRLFARRREPRQRRDRRVPRAARRRAEPERSTASASRCSITTAIRKPALQVLAANRDLARSPTSRGSARRRHRAAGTPRPKALLRKRTLASAAFCSLAEASADVNSPPMRWPPGT